MGHDPQLNFSESYRFVAYWMGSSSRSAAMTSRISRISVSGCFTATGDVPASFVIFDLLSLEGRDVTRNPYRIS